MEKQKFNPKDTLRRSGYKATPSRLAILSILEKSKQPLSPQTVIEKLKKKTDKATIYRTMKSLKRSGIIRQVDFRHNHPHYELADMEDHHHLICLSCGLSEEIMGCEVDSMRKSVLRQTKQFAKIKEHSLEFYGFCKQCLKKKGNEVS